MSHTFVVSRPISASPFHVAPWFRDFANVHRWHPDVVRCRSSDDTRRVLEMSNGDEVVERLFKRDAHSIRADVFASPHPLRRCISGLDVSCHDAGALVTWCVDFESALEGLAMASSQEVR